jgi:signal transduction histidine kinase/ligand-binding sensor domain-containing protein
MLRWPSFVLFVRGVILALAWLPGGGIFLTPVSAAPNYFIRAWQTENGLPQNSVTAVVQTRDGYLWLGTYSGLARFDGARFTVFNDGNTPEMRDSHVTSLFEADDGTLWIGHENGEVTWYKNRLFQTMEVPAAWEDSKIHDIGTDEAGEVWLVNEEGLLARLRDGLVLTPQAGTAAKLVEMARSRSGTIWVLRNGRVSMLEHGQLTALPIDETFANNSVQGIGASQDGGLWVVNEGRIRKWKENKWTGDLGPSPWGGSPVHALIEARKGTLAAGTADHGMYLVFPDASGNVLHFSRTNGFPSDWVMCLLEDGEGNLWAGTGGSGLAVIRPSKIQTIEPPDQWQGRAVLSVTASRNGALWIGTEGAGLYRFQDGTWSNFGPGQGILNPYVWSVAEDAAGELWAGTWAGGLFVRRGNRFEPAPGLEQVIASMPAILCDREGGLWIGTGEGLLRYQAGKASWVLDNRGKKLRDVRAVVEDKDGTIWFGMSSGGLGCWKNGELKRFRRSDGLASDYIQCLHLDDEGALWIGTFGGGLSRLKDGHFSVIGKEQGLPDGVICDVQDDGNGFFWMSSHNGIIRADQAELNHCADGQIKEVHCLTYGISDGLPTLECSGGLQPAGCRTADGRLWFPTSKGLGIVDPQNIITNQFPPPVVIEAMLVDDRRLKITTGSPVLQILPGRHRFEFQYTGLSFIAPEKMQFKYQLEGIDHEWLNAQTRRVATYNYVPPGEYTFQVIACNSDGVWNNLGARITFDVLPYFWQTLQFRILAGMMVIAASSGIAWFGTRWRIRRKLELSERQRAVEHERARIANDIHDDLGTHLTRITMLSESARAELDDPHQAEIELNQIYNTARELTRAMDEIVWAVNPKHDTLDSLVSYLEQFAQDFLATAGIRCRLDMPLELPEQRLTTEMRHNLFLAFKEALNNVVRHAAASEVHVRLVLKAGAFEMSVEDNGCGLEPEAAGNKTGRFASGNGLRNMARRLVEIGGRCDIRSQPGQGTKVLFVVPIRSQ